MGVVGDGRRRLLLGGRGACRVTVRRRAGAVFVPLGGRAWPGLGFGVRVSVRASPPSTSYTKVLGGRTGLVAAHETDDLGRAAPG